MKLIWNPLKGKAPSFFLPDRIENFNHDARDDQNMAVLTAKGEPVCGRWIPGATSRWECRLDPGYELVES